MMSPTTRTGAESKRGMVTFMASFICRLFLPFGRLFLELHAVQPSLVSVVRHPLGMTASFDDLSLVHDHDDVGLFDGRQPVGNDQRGAAFHDPIKGRLNMRFRLGI